jgi:hypothetical protein
MKCAIRADSGIKNCRVWLYLNHPLVDSTHSVLAKANRKGELIASRGYVVWHGDLSARSPLELEFSLRSIGCGNFTVVLSYGAEENELMLARCIHRRANPDSIAVEPIRVEEPKEVSKPRPGEPQPVPAEQPVPKVVSLYQDDMSMKAARADSCGCSPHE